MPERDARVVAIWLKPRHRAPMVAVPAAELVAGRGIVGNANQGGRRQVTMLDADRWEAVRRELGATIDTGARRANIVLRGVELARSVDRTLAIGSCRIRILGETRPCERMDEAWPGLQAALRRSWSGGAYGQVIEGGVVRVDDEVGWVEM